MRHSIKMALTAFLFTLLLFLISVSGWKIWRVLQSNAQAQDTYSEFQTKIATDMQENELPHIEWPALRRQYPDIVGWLFCPDTPINYPIVQGVDNAYYLTHLADGTYNKHGAVFVDCRADTLFVDDNTLIFGHNMQDGSMFSGLLNWGNATYAAEHPTVYVMTPAADYAVQIYTACVVEVTNAVYKTELDADKAAWLDQCARLSYFTADFMPTVQSNIVTFSTCSGGDKRFVVQGAAISVQRNLDENATKGRG